MASAIAATPPAFDAGSSDDDVTHAMRFTMFACRRFAIVGLCLLAAAMAGCATRPTDPDLLAAYKEANDPLEPTNRYIFEVNYALDELVLKPFAGWYYTALPNPVQDGIRNVLNNLRSPVIFANDMFQGNGERAQTTAARFLVNTTLGLLGIIDVATEIGLVYHDEDFGQTLAVAGVDEGPYLMLPLLGPSNPRDLAGRVVDFLLDPFGYIIQANEFGDGRWVLDGLDTRARNLETVDEIRKSAIDYYATIRSLYRQHRNSEIRNGAPAESDIFPEATFEDDPEAPDFETDTN